MNKVVTWIKKHWSAINTTASLLCFGTSLYYTAKASIKVSKIIEEKPVSEEEKKEQKKEIFKEVVPAATVSAITIFSILFMFKQSRQKELALMGAGLLSQSIINGYRDEIEKTYDKEVADKMFRDIFKTDKPDEKEIKTVKKNQETEENEKEYLFCDSISKQFFRSTLVDVLFAENEANRNFILKGDLYFNEFLDFLGLNACDEGDVIGWFEWGEPYYGYRWIDFEHHKETDSNGNEYYLITYPFLPHLEEEGDIP